MSTNTTTSTSYDITVDLDNNRDNKYTVIEKNQSHDVTVGGLSDHKSGNTTVALVEKVNDKTRINGLKAGTVTIGIGSSSGLVSMLNYQIGDSELINGYTLTRTGEVFFSAPGKTTKVPVTTTPVEAFETITWASQQPRVADIDSDGMITAIDKGAAIITGRFTDKWGTDNVIPILVGVEIHFGYSVMSDLLNAVLKGREILDDAEQNPGKYASDDLLGLQEAIEEGERVLEDPTSEDSDYLKAINDLNGFLMDMSTGDNLMGLVAQRDEDGHLLNWLRPINQNVWELLDNNKLSYSPPKYIYNLSGMPEDGNNQTIFGPKNGILYVEDPMGSNIFRPLDSKGHLLPDENVWGGADKHFDTDDDMPSLKIDNKWYVYYGQNVYQEINTTAPIGDPARGMLTGGLFSAGKDGIPGTSDDRSPVFLHSDGKYYAGPFPGEDENDYVYFLDSEDEEEQKYYLYPDGSMDTEKPNDAAPVIQSVTVTPTTLQMSEGDVNSFTAQVQGIGSFSQAVNWSLEGNTHYDTVISNSGLLSVSLHEEANTLTVKATSVLNPAKSGTASVTMKYSSPQLTGASASKIATGKSTFLIKDDDTLMSTGYNSNGQLGLGDTQNRNIFTAVKKDSGLKFKAVSAYVWGSDAHTIAIERTEGKLYAWGLNNHGQLGDNSTGNKNSPIPITATGELPFIAINTAWNSSIALSETGAVYTWGWNGYGQLGDTTTTDQRIPKLITVGDPGTKIIEIAAGYLSMFAITEDGYLYGWGGNNYGQLGDGSKNNQKAPKRILVGGEKTKVMAVSTHSYGHTLALTENGDLYAWGRNDNGQLGNGSTSLSLSPIMILSHIVNEFTAVAAGFYHSLALTADHRLYAWGLNDNGQLGDGSMTRRLTPVWITPGTSYKAIAAGEWTSMAITTDGRLCIWGKNDLGQYGTGVSGSNTRYSVPQIIPLS